MPVTWARTVLMLMSLRLFGVQTPHPAGCDVFYAMALHPHLPALPSKIKSAASKDTDKLNVPH